MTAKDMMLVDEFSINNTISGDVVPEGEKHGIGEYIK